MKKHILLLSIAVIFPCLILYVIGARIVEPLWLIVFIISIVNVCKSYTKREFLIYSLVLFAVSSVVLLADILFDIDYHPEWSIEIRLLMSLHAGYMLILTGIEFLLMWFGLKR